jgi:hypothetical protein
MTTQAERQQKIERLAHLPELLERVVAGLTPEQLTTRYIENEWTVAQNVHHVFDSHARGYVNGKLILSDENPPLKRYNQDAWALMADAVSADLGASLTLIRALGGVVAQLERRRLRAHRAGHRRARACHTRRPAGRVFGSWRGPLPADHQDAGRGRDRARVRLALAGSTRLRMMCRRVPARFGALVLLGETSQVRAQRC